MHTNRPNFINETSVSQVGQIEAKLNEKEKLVESLNEELKEFQEQSSSLASELETYKNGADSARSLEQELEKLQGQLAQLSTLPSGRRCVVWELNGWYTATLWSSVSTGC